MEEKINVTLHDEIYLLGDYIDRGPRAAAVLDYLMFLRSKNFSLHPLMGNHEDMMLRSTSDKRYLNAWLNNGATETLRSFHIAEAPADNPALLSRIPERYMNFLSNLVLYYDLHDYIIVHAGLNFRNENVFEDRDAMLWSREMQYDGKRIGNRTVVHSHTPILWKKIKASLKKKHAGLINLDAGCVYRNYPGYGHLAALDLDSRKLFLQENIEGGGV